MLTRTLSKVASSRSCSVHTAPQKPSTTVSAHYTFPNKRLRLKMKAILVPSFDAPPKLYSDISHPSVPSDPSAIRITLLAAGCHSVVRARAAGTHHTASTAALPFNPGIDGVGRTPDGKLVFFNALAAGQGSFAETIDLPAQHITPIPLPAGADAHEVAARVAAYVNPTLSSWMALAARVSAPPRGFSLLIMGATSASGRIAVRVGRLMGAGKIVGVARSASGLAGLGLDESIVLAEKVEETDFSAAADVDVVLDYLYGAPTAKLFRSLKPGKEVQWVHIGGLAGGSVEVPGDALRKLKLVMRGSGPGSWTGEELGRELPKVVKFVVDKLENVSVTSVRFEDVETVWGEIGKGERAVVVP